MQQRERKFLSIDLRACHVFGAGVIARDHRPCADGVKLTVKFPGEWISEIIPVNRLMKLCEHPVVNLLRKGPLAKYDVHPLLRSLDVVGVAQYGCGSAGSLPQGG